MLNFANRAVLLRRAAASTALGGALLLVPHVAQAQTVPTGGVPVSGGLTIGTPTGNANGGLDLAISQTEARGIVNWQTFNVGQNDRITFNQPDASAAMLNRVTGGTASTIAGQIVANGSVYLVNPNGIAITATGSVQTGGGFIASTLDITDADFNAGTNNFSGGGASARVSNAGSIAASGFAALLGSTVSHSGTISVPTGRVALGSGEAITLDLNGNNFLTVALPTSATTANGAALIDVSGTITAERGRIELKAASAAEAVRNVINVPGTLNVSNAEFQSTAGTIVLSGGDGGVVRLSGTFSGNVPFGGITPGSLTASGRTVDITGATFDFSSPNRGTGAATIQQGSSLLIDDALAVTIGTNLSRSGFSFSSMGDILVNGAITGGNAGKFELIAAGALTFNARIELDPVNTGGSGTTVLSAGGAFDSSRANLALSRGAARISAQSIALRSISAYTSLDVTSRTSITTTEYGGFFLPNGRLTLSAGDGATRGTISAGFIRADTFRLTNGDYVTNSTDIASLRFTVRDFGFSADTASFLRAGGGDGSAARPYVIVDAFGLQGMGSSTLLGSAFKLGNTIDATGTAAWNSGAGFVPIGRMPDDTTGSFTGSLSGLNGSSRFAINGLTINGTGAAGLFASLSGSVSDLNLTNVAIGSSATTASALAAFSSGTIARVDATSGTVTAFTNVGGLVGVMSGGTIDSVRSGIAVTATVEGYRTGGLIGFMTGGTVSNAVATGNVAGRGATGGLIGVVSGGTISASSASGTVSGGGGYNVGGLIGALSNARVTGSSAGGAVSGGQQTGGLIGLVDAGASVVNSSASGDVTSNSIYVGGLVGLLNSNSSTAISSISNSFATGAVTASSGVGGLVGSQLAAGGGQSTITGSRATGAVTSTVADVTQAYAGGLVGRMATTGVTAGTRVSVDGSFATGNVTAQSTSTSSYAGGLVGGAASPASNGTIGISNAYATGNISSRGGAVGGLVGYGANSLRYENVYATGTVAGTWNVGGLIGRHITGGVLVGGFATGQVTATGQQVGGLIGWASGMTIDSAYATGRVLAAQSSAVGGLVGVMDGAGSRITNAYATGAVSGMTRVGGLVGFVLTSGNTITNAYATGSVAGSSIVGGLVGVTNTGVAVGNAYASGAVSGSSEVGGLVGTSNGTVSNSYWDSFSTGRGNAVGSGSVPATVTAVTSDPSRSAAANYAYNPAAYANLTPATGIGSAAASGFVFLPGQNARPFLAFEVPTAARAGAVPTNLASVRTIRNSHELQLIGYNAETLSGNYRLAGNIDLGETGRATGAIAGNYAGMWAPTGFVSLGTDGAGNVWNGTAFMPLAANAAAYGYGGTFDGGGFALSGLTIARPTAAYTGLFGVTNGIVQNVTVTGSVSGASTTGGLVGFLYRGGRVTGSTSAVNVRASGIVVGGLIGSAGSGTVVRLSNASGTVNGTTNVGGLIGYASEATVDRSFATGAASGTSYIGGLIGYSYLGATTDSYARGAATASNTSAGGLIGKIVGGSVARTYSTGAVTAATKAGGLIGAADASASISASYWDTQTSGQAVSAGGMGRTTAQMQDPATYAGWNFVSVWNAPTATTYPTLRPATQPVP